VSDEKKSKKANNGRQFSAKLKITVIIVKINIGIEIKPNFLAFTFIWHTQNYQVFEYSIYLKFSFKYFHYNILIVKF